MAYSRLSALNIRTNSLGEKYEFVNPEKPIGEGGSGVVFMANQVFDQNDQVCIPRAIKFFAFRDDLVEKFGCVANSNFKTEITNITRFSHQNILKVIDGDYYEITIDDNPVRIPYTVTEYVDGVTLDHFFEEGNWEKYISCEDDVFELFLQIANGLDYLHKNRFFHCDIAPKNIFIKTNENSQCLAVIGDLGAGRTIDKDKSGEVLVIGTREYMTPEALMYKNQTISCAVFSGLQPQWDIYSIKKTITDVIQQIIAHKCCDDTWHLERLREKICEREYLTVARLRNDIELLRPASNKVMNLDELSEASNHIRQVLIPLYPAYLSHRMYELSRHSMLLRLMDVSELLEGATTFPGANHTRYEHTLGTYELMRKAILALLRNKSYAVFFDDRTVLIGLLSALLSSIVHFPLSYAAVELVTQERNILQGFSNREFFRSLVNFESYDGSLCDKITDMFSEYGIRMEDIEYVIFGKPNSSEVNAQLEVLNRLLNSSVGVRIIDYMMRDSFHIGLKYRVDIDSLFSFMSIEDGQFCLKQYGITAAEQVIMNRYWMFKRVYWSEPNRANVALLKHLFFLASFSDFPSELMCSSAYMSREKLKQCMLLNSSEHNQAIIKGIFDFLSQKGQRRYKRLVVVGSTDNRSGDLWREVVRKSYSEQESIRCILEEKIKSYLKINTDTAFNMPIILVDIPYEKTGNKLGGDVNVHRISGELESLSKASATIGRMYDSFNEQLAFLRVYLHPQIYDEYVKPRKADNKIDITREIETIVLDTIRYCLGNV